jgi:hypothetical protein
MNSTLQGLVSTGAGFFRVFLVTTLLGIELEKENNYERCTHHPDELIQKPLRWDHGGTRLYNLEHV